MLEKGISRIGLTVDEIEKSMEGVGKKELGRIEKNVAVLSVIAGVAPMFGFVGTILGVIKIFYNIALADNISIGLIAGGLYEKMITSAAGLIVGILAFVLYHWLNFSVDRIARRMEVTALDFIDMLHEPAK
jgi:biopolymer transport protein ExbB